MELLRPLQPQFKIRVLNGKKLKLDNLKDSLVSSATDGKFIDIEACSAYPVVYEEQASLLNTLSFTIDKNADLLLYYFYVGQTVIFYGGYYSDSQSAMRHVFTGTVTRVRTQFSNSGKVSFTVECMNYGFTKLGKDFKNFVYPDSGSDRKFARSETMNLEDIIRGIAEVNNIEVGEIDLSDKARSIKFDKTNIRYQKNISDWKFLTNLAQDFGCNVWMSTENGVDKLNFMSVEKAVKKQSELTFLFPLYGVTNKSLGWDSTIKESEMQRFSNPAYDRPRILTDVTVDEDISMAYAVTRSAMYFDKETGQYKEGLSMIRTDKNGRRFIEFYELDEQRVDYVHNNFPEIADKIRDSSPTSLPWGDPENPDPESACYYYKLTKIYDEQTAVFDKAFYGITVTAKCNQDLDIHSQRSYKIRGILSYHSKALNSFFFLRGLKHIWDSDGNWTELDFIR